MRAWTCTNGRVLTRTGGIWRIGGETQRKETTSFPGPPGALGVCDLAVGLNGRSRRRQDATSSFVIVAIGCTSSNCGTEGDIVYAFSMASATCQNYVCSH